MPTAISRRLLCALGLVLAGAALAADKPVVITPLGSHDGEFCRADRALVLEDPDGTRLLFDAGRTVRGGNDPRLGRIDGVLLSHVHGDHLGDAHAGDGGAGTCGTPLFPVRVAPGSVTVDVVVAKKARLLVGGEMNTYFANRVKAAGGDPALVQLVRFGGSAKVGGVTVHSVPAAHSNGLDPVFLDKPYAEALAANGLTAYVGPAGGYVLQFSNGLAVYLSGDTGITAEQDLVVRGFHKVGLAVLNIGGSFTTGPEEAAYVVNTLVKPAAVIASHANEEATKDGKLQQGSRTQAFRDAVNVPVHVPLSSKPLAFDGQGRCVTGC